MYLTYTAETKYQHIENPTLHQLTNALETMNKEDRRYLKLEDDVINLTIACDSQGERFLLTYKNQQHTRFGETQCLLESSIIIKDDEPDSVFFFAPNGEQHSRHLGETVSKENAIRVATHIFEYYKPPADAMWDVYLY